MIPASTFAWKLFPILQRESGVFQSRRFWSGHNSQADPGRAPWVPAPWPSRIFKIPAAFRQFLTKLFCFQWAVSQGYTQGFPAGTPPPFHLDQNPGSFRGPKSWIRAWPSPQCYKNSKLSAHRKCRPGLKQPWFLWQIRIRDWFLTSESRNEHCKVRGVLFVFMLANIMQVDSLFVPREIIPINNKPDWQFYVFFCKDLPAILRFGRFGKKLQWSLTPNNQHSRSVSSNPEATSFQMQLHCLSKLLFQADNKTRNCILDGTGSKSFSTQQTGMLRKHWVALVMQLRNRIVWAVSVKQNTSAPASVIPPPPKCLQEQTRHIENIKFHSPAARTKNSTCTGSETTASQTYSCLSMLAPCWNNWFRGKNHNNQLPPTRPPRVSGPISVFPLFTFVDDQFWSRLENLWFLRDHIHANIGGMNFSKPHGRRQHQQKYPWKTKQCFLTVYSTSCDLGQQ